MGSAPRVWSFWDMLHVHSGWFISVIAYIARLEGVYVMANAHRQDSKTDTDGIRRTAEALRKQLVKVKVPASVASVDALIKVCDGPKVFSDIHPHLKQINERLTAELQACSLFLMTQEETEAFNRAPEPAVETAFPNAVEDLAEANKCLGLGRYTASIFHLMRAMECAVQELSTALAITNPEREWGKLLSDMETKIKGMPKGDAKDAWSESHSHLYHVKQAWRNKTMHPKKTYTEEEANGVYNAVRSFMRHLAPMVS